MTLPCYDPTSPGATQYLTGKPCSVRGCDKPAGTVWNAELCFDCNVKRLRKIEERK